jgi:hypothetical protein
MGEVLLLAPSVLSLTRISHQPGFAQVQGARFEAVSRYCEALATK